MTVHYEHLHVDISPAALELVEAALITWLTSIYDPASDRVPALSQELWNLVNECRARLQHVAAGEPDISEAQADWLEV